MKLARTVLYVCLVIGLPSSGHAHVTGVLFGDDFSDSSSLAGKWLVSEDGGTVSYTANGLSLRSSSTDLPVIKSKADPFPSYDWSISFGYRYTTIGHYGAQIGCDGPDGQCVFRIHQDMNGQFVQMNGRNLSIGPANTDWHVYTVVKDNDVYEAYLDGQKVGQDNVGLIPTNIVIGTGHQDSPWDFNNIDLQFVRVYAGHQVIGKEVLAVVKPVSAVATAKIPPVLPELDPGMPYDALERITQPGPIRYHVTSLSAFPIGMHTSYILKFQVINETDRIIDPDVDPELRFSDHTDIWLEEYDPASSVAGVDGLMTVISSSPDLSVPPHSTRTFRAFGFDSPFLNLSYGDPGRYATVIKFLDLNSDKPNSIRIPVVITGVSQ